MRLVDRFAYVNHDIDDAVRAGMLTPDSLPPRPVALLGATASERIDALVHDLVETSDAAGAITQSAEYAQALLDLRSFMFERVYLGPSARPQTRSAAAVVAGLLRYFIEHPEMLPSGPEGDRLTRAVDWVAGMTDRYALRAHAELGVSSAAT